ncbi:MAG: CHAT domain-containing protein [Synechococcales cyanobacterium RU_4_20]|nr:CHAT domain-containing protein [Synechococcales cyanobacterium RU_4_20]
MYRTLLQRRLPANLLPHLQHQLLQRQPQLQPQLQPQTQTQPIRQPLQVTAFGLTQAAEVAFQAQPLYFPALPHVAEELGGMKQTMPSSDTLLDSDFTLGRMRQELGRTEPATQVLHLATHTRFGFDGRQTFLVTGRPESLTNFRMLGRSGLRRHLRFRLGFWMLTLG